MSEYGSLPTLCIRCHDKITLNPGRVCSDCLQAEASEKDEVFTALDARLEQITYWLLARLPRKAVVLLVSLSWALLFTIILIVCCLLAWWGLGALLAWLGAVGTIIVGLVILFIAIAVHTIYDDVNKELPARKPKDD